MSGYFLSYRGLKVYNKTKHLIIANFIMALISLAIGGIAAIFYCFREIWNSKLN